MQLGELILALEKEDQNLVLPDGFNSPHSYRGYYEQLAFEPTVNISVGRITSIVRNCLGKIFEGYKGGDFKMQEWSEVWLASYGHCGETIGPILLRLLIAQGKMP